MTARSLLVAILAVLVPALGVSAAEPADGAQADSMQADSAPAYGGTPEDLRPFRETGSSWRFFQEPQAWRGPGRDRPAPEGLSSVKLGLIAPLEGTQDEAIGRAMLHGASLAIDEANARGGFRTEMPYELVVRNDSGLWGASSNTMIDLAYGEHVWAVIGSVDGANTHVALRAALKAEMPIVNTACTDPTLTETAIPWIIRCYPDDRQNGYRLARLLVSERGFRRIAVLRSNDKYGRMGIGEFRDAVRRLGAPIPLEVRHAPGDTEFDAQIQRIRETDADAIVLWTDAADAGRIVNAVREAGLQQPVFGPDRLATREFLAAAGSAGAGVVATSPLDPERQDEVWTAFRERFVRAYGEPPDEFAAFAYDGTRLLLEAIESAGLNRVLIRDALTAHDAWSGVTGTMRFDATHNNLGDLCLLQVREGKLVKVEESADLDSFQTSFRTPPSETFASGPVPVGMVEVVGEAGSEDAVRGAKTAVELANAAGGLRGEPFVLEVGKTEGAWSTAAETCRDLVYEKGCVGVLSPASGTVAHLLAQVAVRGRVPVLVLSGEGSLTRIPDPWLFRVAPDTREVATALATAAPRAARDQGIPVVVPSGRAGRVCREDLLAVERDGGVAFRPVLDLAELPASVEALRERPAVMLLLDGADREEAATLLCKAGWRGTLLAPDRATSGSPGCGSDVVAFSVFDPGDDAEPVVRFVREYRQRWGEDPGPAAACAYDAAALLIDAIRTGGRDRSAVRDRLLAARPSATVTGLAGFDGTGNRLGGTHVSGPPRDVAAASRQPAESLE